jgi:hypothetical protein
MRICPDRSAFPFSESHRSCGATLSGVVAMRAKQLDSHTLVVERQTLGTEQKWTLSFGGKKVRLRGTGGDGGAVSVMGERRGVR